MIDTKTNATREISRVLLTNMLDNARSALFPIREAKQYGTGVDCTPFELVEKLKVASMRNIDMLSEKLTGGNSNLGNELFENLFSKGYSFPNVHAKKLIDNVTFLSKRIIPVMTSIPTLEGEGPEIGKFTLLTRFGGCAVRCKGCDTPHSWNVESDSVDTDNLDPYATVFNTIMDVRAISDLLVQQCGMYNLQRISITGGEPLHYVDALRLLVADLWLRGFYINLETSGTLFDPVIFSMCHVSVDIKTPSARVELSDYQIGALHSIASYEHSSPAHLKAVISSISDLEFVIDNFESVLKGFGKYRPICLTPWAYARQEDVNVSEMSSNVNELTDWILCNGSRLDSRQVRIIGQQHKLLGFE